MAIARRDHTATLLQNGKVLVVGGTGSGILSSGELYDPLTDSWSSAGSMAVARRDHTATLLQNGKVLVAGGFDGSAHASAEIYDTATGSWSSAGTMVAARYAHTATLLTNGKVLVSGGSNWTIALDAAELYDPSSDSWSGTSTMATARYGHQSTLLHNGNVLVVGGSNYGSVHSSAELFDSAAGRWNGAGTMATARFFPTATLLQNGNVLVAGGADGSIAVSSAELYRPAYITQFHPTPFGGFFTADQTADTNGQWGLSHPWGMESVSVNGDVLNYIDDYVFDTTVTPFQRVVTDPANPLVGLWYGGDPAMPDSLVAFAFFANGHFVMMQDGDSVVDPNGTDGMERGTFTWDSETGAFTTEVLVDTNGEWGLSHPLGAETITVNGDTMTYSVVGEGDFTFNRLPSSSNNPLIGGWFKGDASTDDNSTLLVIVDDNKYVFAEDYDPVVDPSGQDGMERGTYTLAPILNTLKVNLALSASDDVGVTGYFLAEDVTPPLASASGWTAKKPALYSFADYGPKQLHVWAKDADGNVSNIATTTFDLIPICAVPAQIYAPETNSTGSYKVSWNYSTTVGVTYKLYEDGVEIYSGSNNYFTVTGKANGPYRYTVRATKDGHLNSVVKGPVTTTVSLACAAPAQIYAPATNSSGSYNVSWNYSTTPGVTYILEESDNAGVDWTVAATTTSNSVKLTKAAGGSYRYKVRATKAGHADSAEVGTVTTVVTLVCDTPAQVYAPTNSTTDSYTVSWKHSLISGATYVLEESNNGGTSWTAAATTTNNAVKLTGRTNGTYQYRVKATKTGYTESPPKGGVSTTVLLTCAVPANIYVPTSTNTTGSYIVSWNLSTTPGATYVLEESTNGGTNWTQVATPTSYNYKFTNKANGNYMYRVKAVKGSAVDSGYRESAEFTVAKP